MKAKTILFITTVCVIGVYLLLIRNLKVTTMFMDNLSQTTSPSLVRDDVFLNPSISTPSIPTNPIQETHTEPERVVENNEVIHEKKIQKKKSETPLKNIKDRHIDFYNDNWYEDFRSQVDDIYEHYNPEDNTQFQDLYVPDGYSKLYVSKYFAFVTNVCYDMGSKSVILYTNDTESLNNQLGSQVIKKKYFYFNGLTIKNQRMPDNYNVLEDMGIYVSHPRQGRQTYHFMEAYTYLLNVALQPEIHPPISKVYIVDFDEGREYPWSVSASKLIMDVFPESFRPQLLYQKDAKHFAVSNRLCARGMTFIHNWDIGHGGYLIGNYFAVDALRAVAYKSFNPHFNREMPEKLALTILARRNKRRIINEDELVANITENYAKTFTITTTVFDKKTPKEQYECTAYTDILLTPHGAGLINIFYLLPHSYVLEMNPPLWKFGCYKEQSKSSDVEHRFIQAKGKKVGKECTLYGMSDRRCHFAGIRDQDFYADIPDVFEALNIAIKYVRRNKYISKTSTN